MVIIFKLIILTCIIVLSLKILLSKGMLLERVGEWLEDRIDNGEKVYNIFYCQWCMASLQSITAHVFAFGLSILPLEFNWQLLIRWPLVVMGASFISGNLWNLYETINKIKEKNELEAEYYNSLFENKD